MKKLLLSLLFMFAFIPMFAQGETPVEGTDWILIIISVLIALEEIIARLLPGKFSGIVGVIINILKQISDYLNREK